MTRWLSEDEQRVWRAFLESHRLFFSAIQQQLQDDSGLPHTYYEILVRLSEAPQRTLRMSELASRSQSSKSRLSHAIARLEERGWVRRRECPGDRRGQLAELTDEGFKALEAAAPGHVERVRTALLDPLTPEQVSQLGEISERIVEKLRAEGVQGSCDGDG